MYVHQLSKYKENPSKILINSNTLSAVTCVHGCISLLVDTTCHVFNIFGFILQATVIVVSLHTCLYFTPDGSAQLSAKRAFLEKIAKNTVIFYFNVTFKAGVR